VRFADSAVSKPTTKEGGQPMITSGRSRLLTPTEEIALGVRAHAGDLSARDDLVLANVGLVPHLIHGMLHRTTEDLEQAGLMGLITAADRYDPEANHGTRFSTYAGYWIRCEVRHSLAADELVHLPVYLKLKPAADRPADSALKARNRAANLDAAGRAKVRGNMPLEAADPAVIDPMATMLRDERVAALRAALGCLSAVELLLTVSHYGLDNQPAVTMAAIARAWGISRHTVGLIQTSALAKLRIQLGDCATP
jgi:RNA polymerase primary sigma factor